MESVVGTYVHMNVCVYWSGCDTPLAPPITPACSIGALLVNQQQELEEDPVISREEVGPLLMFSTERLLQCISSTIHFSTADRSSSSFV